MASGAKTEIINTRERAVSTDLNRLQSFIAADRAEELRRVSNNRQTQFTDIQNAQGGAFLEGGSYIDTSAQDTAAIGAPLRGDVYEGLVVLPQPTTLNLLVSPGIVGLDDPDGQAGSSQATPPDPDDSRYKVVDDAGIQTIGVLVVTAGGGGPRIDVVECQRTEVVTETDSRDIFDPSTGVFVPTVVNKVIEGQLIYRIRLGTPNGGYPGSVQGWLPLCVILVPSTAASVDDCTFWDVRPLIKDRVTAFDSQHDTAFMQDDMRAVANQSTDPTKTLFSGFLTSQIGMYRAGGGFIAVDLQSVANQALGYAPVTGEIFYVYVVFPAGLPRWVQYSASSSRVPASNLGILSVSAATPLSQLAPGIFNSISPPLATGILVSGPAVLLAAGRVGAANVLLGFAASAGLVSIDQTDLSNLKTPTSTSGNFDQFVLTAGVDYPITARSVLVRVACIYSGGTPGDALIMGPRVATAVPGSTTMLFEGVGSRLYTGIVPPSGGGGQQADVEVPVLMLGSSTGFSSDDLNVVVDWGNTLTRASQNLNIIGWRL